MAEVVRPSWTTMDVRGLASLQYTTSATFAAAAAATQSWVARSVAIPAPVYDGFAGQLAH